MKNNITILYAPLILLYLIGLQTFMTYQIRQELRHELGFINVFIFPITLLLSIVCWIYVFKSKKISRYKKRLYSILSSISYAFIVYNILT